MMSDFWNLLDNTYLWYWTTTTTTHHVLVASIATLMVTVGLSYLFYPAIVAARENNLYNKKKTVHVECIATTTSSSSSSSSQQQQQEKQESELPFVILSIIIPSYNEELRLPVMLQEAYSYLSMTRQQPKQQQQQQPQPEPPKALEYLMQATRTCRSTTTKWNTDAVVLGDHQQQQRINTNTNTNSTTIKTEVAIEWIVVDDGSTDQTGHAFRAFVQQQQQAHDDKNQSHHTSTATATDTATHTDTNSNNNNNNQSLPSDCSIPQTVMQHCWKLVTLSRNSGKGAAVQAGMLTATGAFCLMADADGATSFGAGLESITKELVVLSLSSSSLHHYDHHTMNQTSPPPTVWLGSRADLQRKNCNSFTRGTTTEQHQQQHQQGLMVERSLIRKLVSTAFHKLRAFTLGGKEIADTQCGFKLFSAAAAQSIFKVLHLRRWAFDIEVVYLALHLNYSVREVIVPWHEVEGSKLSTSPLGLALVSLSMLRDMICVRLCYSLGIWTVVGHDDRKRRS